MERQTFSEPSELTELFRQRAGANTAGPEDAVLRLVSELRRSAKTKLGQVPLDKYLTLRKVVEVSHSRDPGFDAKIEPVGKTYADGFRIVINRSASASRARFSLAHELCHTFFYELVPEIKFLPRPTDSAEERLCNLGAAELLMPAKLVKRESKGHPICLKTLEQLATFFRVSNEAMAFRLNQLGLWRVEFSTWMKLTNGKFSMEKVVGGKSKDWEWPNASQLEEAWTLGRGASGHQFLTRLDDQGVPAALSIRFDLARRGNRICMLWGKGVSGSDPNRGSLFRSQELPARNLRNPLTPRVQLKKGQTPPSVVSNAPKRTGPGVSRGSGATRDSRRTTE